MSDYDDVSRRHVLGMSFAVGGLAMLGSAGPLLAEKLRRTPAQILGPFYPVVKPLDQDAVLTIVKGRSGRAAGQVIHVMGRVLDSKGRPLPGIRIEIWQANTYGRYTHPSDINPAPLDPNFEGFAVLTSDSEGRYRFKTIKPGAYPADATGAMRPPHIHFDIAGKVNRVVTQMYFAGEPLNDTDRLLQTASAKELLIVTLQPPTQDLEADSLLATWNIVLDVG